MIITGEYKYKFIDIFVSVCEWPIDFVNKTEFNNTKIGQIICNLNKIWLKFSFSVYCIYYMMF